MNTLTIDELHSRLCSYDERNPLRADLVEPGEEAPAAGAPGCACDNCFYGRHRMADELLRFRLTTNRDGTQQHHAALMNEHGPVALSGSEAAVRRCIELGRFER